MVSMVARTTAKRIPKSSEAALSAQTRGGQRAFRVLAAIKPVRDGGSNQM